MLYGLKKVKQKLQNANSTLCSQAVSHHTFPYSSLIKKVYGLCYAHACE